MKNLNDSQIYDIIKQYVEIKVDRMDTQELVERVTENLVDWYSDFTLDELKDTVDDNGQLQREDITDYEAYQIFQQIKSIRGQS